MILHDYYRSSCAYRVRIALNLKGLAYEAAAHHLRRGEHRAPDYLALNPHGLIPALEVDGLTLVQSVPIIEYLDETRPAPPLLPADPAGRARVRGLAQAIASDIHPIDNLRVLNHLRALGQDEPAVRAWYNPTGWEHDGDDREMAGLSVRLAPYGIASAAAGRPPPRQLTLQGVVTHP